MFVQAIGIAAMAANVLSYQFKTPKRIMTFQFMGSFLFMINLYLTGAFMGAILNMIGVARALVYINSKRIRIPLKYVNGTFILLYIVSYACVFTVFQKEPTVKNFIVEFLPLVGMTASTVGFALNNAKMIRLLGFINSPSWLIYNIFYGAIGGILCECFGLASVLSAYIRHDLPKKKQKDSENE